MRSELEPADVPAPGPIAVQSKKGAPPVIRVSGVSKAYRIYDRPVDRLRQLFLSPFRKWAGHEKPDFYRQFWALNDVEFAVSRGETLGIVGKNGSGKSTLLQILCGVIQPTAGQVEVNGKVCALLELGSGFNPEFTGRENVYINGAVLGLRKGQIDERMEAILEFADIGDFIDQPVKHYSSGMYVRLAFAVVAHADADILIVDEALSVGDVFFGQKCMRFLRDFMLRGTVVFVSHDTAAVTNLCDRVIWLDNGVPVADGDAKDVMAQYLKELYYDDNTGDSVAASVCSSSNQPSVDPEKPRVLRDLRQDLVNASSLRNDIELFDFSANCRAFGQGGAIVDHAELQDALGNPLSWVVGGEPVRLSVFCTVKSNLLSPIVGFEVYDRLGQIIFADNTYLAKLSSPAPVCSGDRLVAEFDFVMPVMRDGDYTMSVAIADGTQEAHVQHHWLYEAMAFTVHAKTICLGLVGVPMSDIKLLVQPAEVAEGRHGA